MIREEEFWACEADAPLLNENYGFLKKEENDEALAVVKKWVELVGADPEATMDVVPPTANAELQRIFGADAERTFKSDTYRTRMVAVLNSVAPDSYHQGLGYVTSFLLLVCDTSSALKILSRLKNEARYSVGYWMSAPDAFVRDAIVYFRLVKQFFPEVHAQIEKAGIVPESYASKWFVGLCVHVLPFKALFSFYEAYFELGNTYLFQFACALIQAVSDKMLAVSGASEIFSLLRLDNAIFPPENEEFYMDLVQSARTFDLSSVDLPAMRAQAADEVAAKMAAVRKREAELAAESDEDIVFSDEED